MARLVHRKLDALSPTAKLLLNTGFELGIPYSQISQTIKMQTGEDAHPRSIQRAAVNWRRLQLRKAAANLAIPATASLAPNLDELCERVDVSAGWFVRRKRIIEASVHNVLKEPNHSAIRALHEELTVYLLEFRLSSKTFHGEATNAI